MTRLPGQSHADYIRMLRAMTPEQRLAKAFELSEQTREEIRTELLGRFPDLTQQELAKLVRARLDELQRRDP